MPEVTGTLNRRITIQLMTDGQDTRGAVTQTPSTFATVWAHVEPLAGAELFTAQRTQAEVTTRFLVRYLPGLKPKMRISYAGQNYDILSMRDVDTGHRLVELLTVLRDA